MPRKPPQIWRLHHGDHVVAEFHEEEFDFPTLGANAVKLPGFEAVASLFAEDLKLLNAAVLDVEAFEKVQNEIRRQTSLTDPDGRDVAEYLLHIEGDRAWWRWSYEPFDDPG